MKYLICSKCGLGAMCLARQVSVNNRATGEYKSYYIVKHKDGSTERVPRFTTRRAPDGSYAINMAV